MEDAKFFALATKLTQLSGMYTGGALKHYQYASEYDKALESYGITKKQLAEEASRRLDPKFNKESTVSPNKEPAPIPKKR